MKVIADSDIPFLKGVLEPFLNVIYIKGADITAQQVKDADVLLVRTRTRCNRELLDGSAVKLIVTATIGTDHIDGEWCASNGIKVFNAAGCNALGVVQYVLTSLFVVAKKKGIELKGKSLGIVGAGNVGERLAGVASGLGFRVLRCDPPLKKRLIDNPDSFLNDELRVNLTESHYYELDTLLNECDIISLHTPLDKSTLNMSSNAFFKRFKEGAIFINSSRGEVVDEAALLNNAKKLGAIITDVWRNEPNINLDYLSTADIATPHIAGYSMEGKVNATVYSVRNVGKELGIGELANFDITLPEFEPRIGDILYENKVSAISNILESIFPLMDIDLSLRSNPRSFEDLRNNFVYRREIPKQIIDYIRTII